MTERIVSAAVWAGSIISLPPPARHHTILNSMSLEMGLDATMVSPVDQGFLTSTGRFVNRVEAFYIAEFANQIISERKEPHLFSEDLW